MTTGVLTHGHSRSCGCLSSRALIGQRRRRHGKSGTRIYWVWQAIEIVKPRVVAIEYNATLRPPMSVVVPYRPDAEWDGSNYYGASLAALVKLGGQKNYRIVGCSIAGVNAFFVRADLVGDHFHGPPTAEEHYEPPRHHFYLLPSGGHRSRPGPFVTV